MLRFAAQELTGNIGAFVMYLEADVMVATSIGE